jgi:all-trans-retinol 13,14-reductase
MMDVRMSETKFDVIVIGSGIGGLSAASVLSQHYGKKVLVLEQHGKFGGFTHAFKRKVKFHWDVGVHYIGDMMPDSPNRIFFDYVTGTNLLWQKMPDPYDVIMLPDFTFSFRVGKNNLLYDLIGSFSEEKNAIKKYFRDLHKVSMWFSRYAISGILPKFLSPLGTMLRNPGQELALLITKDYLDANFKNEKLKALLTAQWGNYGLPPAKSAFVTHALIVQHYFEGGWYPVGGAQNIADNIKPLIEKNGGQLLNRHTVSEIIVKNNRAIGVKVLIGREAPFEEKEFFADKIISNTGAYNTYLKLLPEGVQEKTKKQVAEFPKGTSNVTLFLGLKEDPRKTGFNGENYWISTTYNHDQLFKEKDNLFNGKASHCYLSFPSLKDPNSENHTAEIIAFMNYEPFKDWAEKPFKNRGEDYEAIKERISNSLIDFVEERLPGLKDLIEFYELGTPLTTEHYTNHHLGNIYGLPGIPDRFKMNWIQNRTPVKNLFLCGADTAMHGVVPSMYSGIIAALMAKGKLLDIIKIYKQGKKLGTTSQG